MKPSKETSQLLRIGELVRMYREKTGRNLADVAAAAGISVSMQSQIERGKVSPSIDTLYRVCESLDLEVTDLFARLSLKKPVRIFSSGARLKTSSNGVSYEQLVSSPDGKYPVEMFLLEVECKKTSGMSGGGHDGVELGYVLAGKAFLTIGESEYTLTQGDSVSFDAHSPHKLTNAGPEKFVAVWSVAPPHKDYLEVPKKSQPRHTVK